MAINKKTFLDKCNTIINGSNANTGLNPIIELKNGASETKCLIYFSHNELKHMVDDKIYPDLSKLKHTLKLINSSSINTDKLIYKDYDNLSKCDKERATSFDLVFFLIPELWDNGRGYDYEINHMPDSDMAYNEQPSNWYNSTSGKKWETQGVYTNDFIYQEYLKYKQDKSSKVVIATQHFDIGNENIEVDVTETVNKFITGELVNNGIGIAFAEHIEDEKTFFVSFFSNRTHSFYEPCIETTYDDYIKDDRSKFYLDKNNRLYFYSFLGSNLTNLDELPNCTINGSKMQAKQATKGVYYVDINISSEEFEAETMLYDVWSNIKINGRILNDVELYFTTLSKDEYFHFGLPSSSMKTEEIIPTVYGIDFNEKIKRGDIRKINIECKIPYTSNQLYSVENLYYRLYVKSGNDDFTVIDWEHVEETYNNNYFIINTNDLVPNHYFIDIKYTNNDEVINHAKVLEFDIVNQIDL